MIIFDGHNDTLTNLCLPEKGQGRPFFKESETGHIDLPRAKKGGLIGGMFSINVPTPKDSIEADDMYGFTFNEHGYKQTLRTQIPFKYAKEFTGSVLELMFKLETESDGKVKIVKSYSELEDCLEKDILGIVLHFEGAEAIHPSLNNLEDYYRKGLRALGLVWSRPNAFGHGVYYAYPQSPDIGYGLTSTGKKLVKECNRLGIVIDLAHMNEQGFWNVAEFSTAPLVVSHADIHTLCPSTRNVTDQQLDAIGKSGGVIGINFEPISIGFESRLLNEMSMEEVVQHLNSLPLSQIVKHIDYAVKRIGIDHVALGSDFDGADMPSDLKDVTGLPKLVAELEKSGYNQEAIEKICYKNWLRVFKESWKE